MDNKTQLTEQEANEILLNAESIMNVRAAEQISFTLELPVAVALISQIQVAFSHPDNTGSTRAMMENLLTRLIDGIAPEPDALRQLLMLGFEAEFDTTVGGTNSIKCRHCTFSFPLVHAIVKGYCPYCREHICPACGCTDSAGCEIGCFWLPSGICSSCGKDLD